MPTYRTELITPKLAIELLEKNTNNRKINQSAVNEYTRAMKEGKWRRGVGAITIATNDRILDGQHRLFAIIESDTDQEFLIVEGVDPDAFMVMDAGRKRSLSDTLSMEPYKLKDATQIAAILQVALRWTQGERGYRLTKIDTRGGNIQIPDLVAFYNEHTEIQHVLDQTKHVRRAFKIPPRVLGLAYWVLSSISEDDANDFFNRLAKGAGLEEGDAIWALREALVRYFTNASIKVTEPTYLLALIFKTWNAYRDGTPIKLLKFNMGGSSKEAFPEPH